MFQFMSTTEADITMCRVSDTKIEFLEPWCEFVPGEGDFFLQELKCEISPGHPLECLVLTPLGHSGAADDALFRTEDGRVFQVHLTFSRRAEQPPFPYCEMFSTVEDWIQQVMVPANEEWRPAG